MEVDVVMHGYAELESDVIKKKTIALIHVPELR
jgi:hypothetical protein